jgi:hypothetical protein
MFKVLTTIIAIQHLLGNIDFFDFVSCTVVPGTVPGPGLKAAKTARRNQFCQTNVLPKHEK